MSSTYFGLYRGTCSQDVDPLGRFRIRVRVPAVLGTEEAWALPCLPPGWQDHLHRAHSAPADATADGNDGQHDTHSPGVHAHAEGSGEHSHTGGGHEHPHELLTQVPEIGGQVWIMFEAGDLAHPVWLGVW